MRKIALALCGVGFALGLAVGVDRIAGVYLNGSGYFKAISPGLQAIIQAGDFSVPFTIRTQGLREHTVTNPKPKGSYRILVLGDSFTFGWGVSLQQAWPALLERKVNDSLHVRGIDQIEFINAGVPGAGPSRVTLVCQAYAEQFDVDAILLAIHTDDFYQAAARDVSTTRLEKIMLVMFPTLSRLGNPYIQQLEGLDFIKHSQAWKDMIEESIESDPNILPQEKSASLVYRALRDSRFMGYLLEPGLFERSFEAALDQYRVLMATCAKDKPVLVVFLPGSVLVSEYYIPFREQVGFIVNADLPKTDIDRYVVRLATMLGVDYVSVVSDFRSDGCRDCYYPRDGHLNVHGHERAASAIAPKVLDWLNHEL